MTDTGVLTSYKSPLHQMTQTTPTCLWNDSAAIDELTYSLEHGGVGATCNPVIVLGVLKKEMQPWRSRIETLIDEMPTATEDQIAWKLVEEVSARAAALRNKAATVACRSKPTRASLGIARLSWPKRCNSTNSRQT